MKKVIKIIIAVILCIILVAGIVIGGIFVSRMSLKNVELPENFQENLEKDAFENDSDIRVMSSNLLVHFNSWGGKPVKPRAKIYVNMLEEYKPDVIGIQECSDAWYSALVKNLPDGYKMLNPFKLSITCSMTGMIYNEETLDLIDYGYFTYTEKDNPRLRIVNWGVFKDKETGKTFAATNTHFSLIVGGREEETEAVMKSQVSEISAFIDKLNKEYNCPVIAVGDYNTMENRPETKPSDVPQIYESLCEEFNDAKYIAEKTVTGPEVDFDFPSYDHIFICGDVEVETFALLAYDYMTPASDHYPIFADINI